jgi:hypothetical protein
VHQSIRPLSQSAVPGGQESDKVHILPLKGVYPVTMKIVVFMLMLSVPVFGQQSRPSTNHPIKSALSESFAKTGLRALIAIADYDGEEISKDAKKAYQEAEAECDFDKPGEAKMFSNLTVFKLLRSMHNLKQQANVLMSDDAQEMAKEEMRSQEQKCSAELDKAFRHRVAIGLPTSCSSPK